MSPDTPAAAWRALCAGNSRFVDGSREHPNQDLSRRAQLAAGQNPFAVIFSCADSRVASEIIFDRGLGDLFVVRTAGHVIDSGVLGSIEFGVTDLDTPLVVVLGHDQCGAISAALHAQATGQMPGGYVRDIVERVIPSLITAQTDRAASVGRPAGDETTDGVGDEHVRHTSRLIVERSAAIAARVARGECAVVGAAYRLVEGRIRLVDAIGDIGETPSDIPS